MSFEVEIKDLRDSAKAARESATAVAKVTPGTDLTAAKSAMPGASCLATMDAVAGDWFTELGDWVKAARGYAESLETNATQYESDDAAARTVFTASGPGAPGAKPAVSTGVHPKYRQLAGSPE